MAANLHQWTLHLPGCNSTLQPMVQNCHCCVCLVHSTAAVVPPWLRRHQLTLPKRVSHGLLCVPAEQAPRGGVYGLRIYSFPAN